MPQGASVWKQKRTVLIRAMLRIVCFMALVATGFTAAASTYPLAAAASPAILWGIDSCDPASGVVPQTQQLMGVPQVMGALPRLQPLRNGPADLIGSLVPALARDVSGPYRQPGRLQRGQRHSGGPDAIQQAQSLGAPRGTAIFRDVEQSDPITAAYITDWYNAFAQSESGYVVGFYENAINGVFSGRQWGILHGGISR